MDHPGPDWIFEMEEDPEIFAAVARLYPDQVVRVLIRDGSDLSTINVAEKADHDAL